MSEPARPKRILIVTGLSGAGKTTALKTFEDLGWETVDHLPLDLLDRLLGTPLPEGAGNVERPLAFGIDSRTRGFDADAIIRRVDRLRSESGFAVDTLFLDCSGAVLIRRFSETRRRHPLAMDRPAEDGIARERELTAPLRAWADHLIDTSETSTNALQQELRARFGDTEAGAPTLSIQSFGFSRGVPRTVDLLFDMRFLRNPHWDALLRPMTGHDAAVGAYIAEDPAYDEAVNRIEELILLLLPRYASEGKSYVSIAFGCTGGRHRSVHVAERVARRLRNAAFSPTVSHRDLVAGPRESGGERAPEAKGRQASGG
ncbi:MAG: nucleotide-binding protein [Sphingomonas bacterium]|nr:nucleotide-binding protein [Sphingomonas bacterium]